MSNIKPKIYQSSENLIHRIIVIWCIASVFLGIFLLEIIPSIVIPLMCGIMSFISYWSIKALLRFQRLNNSNLSKGIYDSIIGFFWLSGIWGTIMFIGNGIHLTFFVNEADGAYLLMAGVFPLGVSVGASSEWALSDNFH
jgi:hypothetical protein